LEHYASSIRVDGNIFIIQMWTSTILLYSACVLMLLSNCRAQNVANYFIILEENNGSCTDRCSIIQGTCDEGAILSLSQNRYRSIYCNVDSIKIYLCRNLCLQSFRSILRINNIGFAESPINNTRRGGCIARNGITFVEVQTATLQSDCSVRNPAYGGWKRLCPCTVISTPSPSAVPTIATSEIPTAGPSIMPTLLESSMPTSSPTQILRVLNTLYIIGINISFIESGCGVEQFYSVVTSSIASVLGVNESDVTEVHAYDLLLVGLEYQVVAVAFEVRSNSVGGGADGIDRALNIAIRSGDLLMAIKSYGRFWNCSLANSDIGGYNGNIPGYTSDVERRDPCERFVGAVWRRVYNADSYGPWAGAITALWAILTVIVLIMALRYTSCVSYGVQQRVQFKYLWAVVFAAVTCRFVVASVVLTAWQTDSQDVDSGKGFACSEMQGYTPSDVSQRSMQALLLLFHALMTCMLAG
jgi:hypothetical protein